MILQFRLSNSGFRPAMYPSSVVHTGVKSFGCENRIAQPSPIHSWKLIGPWVVSAVKFGASLLIRNAMSDLLSRYGHAPRAATARVRRAVARPGPAGTRWSGDSWRAGARHTPPPPPFTHGARAPGTLSRADQVRGGGCRDDAYPRLPLRGNPRHGATRPSRATSSRPEGSGIPLTRGPRSASSLPPRSVQELVRPLEDRQADEAPGRPGAVHRARPAPHEVAGGALAVLVPERPLQHERLLDPDVAMARQPRPRLHARERRPPAGGVLVEELRPDAGERRRLPRDPGDVQERGAVGRVDDHRAALLGAPARGAGLAAAAHVLPEQRDPLAVEQRGVQVVAHAQHRVVDEDLDVVPELARLPGVPEGAPELREALAHPAEHVAHGRATGGGLLEAHLAGARSPHEAVDPGHHLDPDRDRGRGGRGGGRRPGAAGAARPGHRPRGARRAAPPSGARRDRVTGPPRPRRRGSSTRARPRAGSPGWAGRSPDRSPSPRTRGPACGPSASRSTAPSPGRRPGSSRSAGTGAPAPDRCRTGG